MRRGARQEAADIPDMARTRAAKSGCCRTGATGDHQMNEPRKIFNRLARSRTNEVEEDRSFEWIYGANSSKKPAAEATSSAAGGRREPIASFPDEAAAPAGPSEIAADLLEDARARTAAILSAEAETVLKEAVATVTVMLAEAERERARIGREIARWQEFLEEERRQLSALLEVALEQVERGDGRSRTVGSVSRLTPAGTQSADSLGTTSDPAASAR